MYWAKNWGVNSLALFEYVDFLFLKNLFAIFAKVSFYLLIVQAYLFDYFERKMDIRWFADVWKSTCCLWMNLEMKLSMLLHELVFCLSMLVSWLVLCSILSFQKNLCFPVSQLLLNLDLYTLINYFIDRRLNNLHSFSIVLLNHLWYLRTCCLTWMSTWILQIISSNIWTETRYFSVI